jgi:hypothetical protein
MLNLGFRSQRVSESLYEEFKVVVELKSRYSKSLI